MYYDESQMKHREYIKVSQSFICTYYPGEILSFNPSADKEINKSGKYSNEIVSCKKKNCIYFTEKGRKALSCYFNNAKLSVNKIEDKDNLIRMMALSKDDELLTTVRSTEKVIAYDTETFEPVAEFAENRITNIFFDYNYTTLIISKISSAVYYCTETWKPLVVQYRFNPGFLLHTQPDSSSAFGWFHTNTPEVINVYKSNHDGSEPELTDINATQRK